MRNETDICSCHTWILALPRLGGSNCRALEPSDSSEKAVSADALSVVVGALVTTGVSADVVFENSGDAQRPRTPT